MKKNYYVVVFPLLLLVILKIEASPTITFFFRPLHDIEHINKKIKKPGKLAKYTARGMVNHAPVSGLLVTYGGYVTSSSYNGEVIFPRKHQKSVITIAVTPEMAPVALFENTILHWKFIQGIPAKMYLCEQKKEDKTGLYHWETQEMSLPIDNVIPLTTLVIIANPKNIIINVGKTPTLETANLVLPDIYVKKGINIIENSSYMLTVRHLFKPIETEEKREPFKIFTQVID